MKLSIVSTLYFSERYIKEFCERIIKIIPKEFEEFEIILVNDGSPDQSLQAALNLKKEIHEIKIINLSRNFGHHKAIVTGLEFAIGDYVFLIDCDLEESPELLLDFWNEIIHDREIDVVYGVQIKRKGSYFEKITGALFYYFFNRIVNKEYKIAENLSTVRLMSNNYVKEFLKYKSNNYVLGPILQYIGFNQKKIYFKKNSSSKTSYSFYKKFQILINSTITFSVKPLYLMFYIGVFITFFSFLIGLYFIYQKITNNIATDGWTSLVVSLYFLSGIIITFLGVISIYISKIISEVNKSPFSIVKQIYK